MKKQSILRAVLYSACLLCVWGGITLYASGQDDTDRLDPNVLDQRSPSCCEGSEHSPGQIMSESEIAVPQSSKVVHLWEELLPDGTQASFYSIHEDDGEDTASRPVGRVRQADYRIGLRYANFDPLADSPAVDPSLRVNGGNELYLVQFWTVPLKEFQDQIEALDGRIYRYLPDHTHIVQMSAMTAGQVARLPYVRWVGEFHPAYKLDEAIVSAHANGLDAVEGAQEGLGEFYTKNEYSIEVFERAGGGPVVEKPEEWGDAGMISDPRATAARQASGGLGQQAVVRAAIEAMGGRVSVVTPGGFRMQATLTMDQLIQVAQMNEVHFIEPWGYGGTD